MTAWHPTRELVELLCGSRFDDLRDAGGIVRGIADARFVSWMENEKKVAGKETARRVRGMPTALPPHLEGRVPPSQDLIERQEFSVIRIAERCGAMKLWLNDWGGDYPLWRAGIGVAVHCVEGDDFTHEVCQGHPRYSPEDTQAQIENWRESGMGATTCQALNDACQCKSWCPFYAKGKTPNFLSPIALGRPEVKAGDRVPTRVAGPPPEIGRRRVPVSTPDPMSARRVPVTAPPPMRRVSCSSHGGSNV